MPTMMPRVPAMTKWCFSLGRGNIPPRWILAGQNVLSKMPWLFEDWDYFALYASVRCLRCEHWRLMRLFYLLREGASKPYSRLCPPQRPTVWVLEWSPADFANFWTNSNVLRARDEQPLMEDHNIFWDLYKQTHLNLLNGADVSCQCNLEVSILCEKKKHSPKILPCCQYIVIFLSFIPGSERMAIYIAPLHCHGECLSSSHRQRDPPQQYTKYTNTKYKYNTIQ